MRVHLHTRIELISIDNYEAIVRDEVEKCLKNIQKYPTGATLKFHRTPGGGGVKGPTSLSRLSQTLKMSEFYAVSWWTNVLIASTSVSAVAYAVHLVRHARSYSRPATQRFEGACRQ